MKAQTQAIVFLFLLVSWFPITGAIQIVSYLFPLFIFAGACISGVVRFSRSDVVLVGLGATAALFLSVFYLPSTGIWHPVLFFLSHSALVLLAVRFRNPEAGMQALVICTIFFSIVEGLWGIGQLIVQEGGLQFRSGAAAGDAVTGSLGTNSHLFAVKMLFQALFLLFVREQIYRKSADPLPPAWLLWSGISLAAISALLASALLTTIVFAGAVLLVTVNWAAVAARLLTFQWRWQWLLFVGGTIVLLLFFANTQPRNVTIITRNLNTFLEEGPRGNPIVFQKLLVFEESVREILLRDVATATFGVGPGRYSSRAAMFLSGGYLRNHPSFIPVSRSAETDTHIYPRWNPSVWSRYGGSIMGMPTSSVQSVLLELGIAGFAAFAWYFGTIIRRTQIRLSVTEESLPRAFLRMVSPFVIALWGISLTDLWLEYPQITVYICLVVALALSKSQSSATPLDSEASSV